MKTTEPATLAQALALHRTAQAVIDAHFGNIEDEALANQLFSAASTALEALAETPCASDAEFIEKLRYLLPHEARMAAEPLEGCQDFGSILVAVDRHFKPQGGQHYTDAVGVTDPVEVKCRGRMPSSRLH